MFDENSENKREKRRVKKTDVSDWRVLIVEDKIDNVMVARETLRFHGATVEIAKDGYEALSILETFDANIILADLSMPEMDGWEMHRRIRADEGLRDLPVIALTAHAMAGDKEKVEAAGFDGYIAKPFSVTTFVAQIQSILASMKHTGV